MSSVSYRQFQMLQTVVERNLCRLAEIALRPAWHGRWTGRLASQTAWTTCNLQRTADSARTRSRSAEEDNAGWTATATTASSIHGLQIITGMTSFRKEGLCTAKPGTGRIQSPVSSVQCPVSGKSNTYRVQCPVYHSTNAKCSKQWWSLRPSSPSSGGAS